MYDNIKNIIKNKKPNIEEETLKYFTNYFYVVCKKEVIPEDVKLEELIDNVLIYDKIIFFKDDDPIAQKYGNQFKGYRDSINNIIYVRDSLSPELKEMVLYHEIHHAAQTSKDLAQTEKCGINQEENYGRMIMEAQTQWFAEEVYKEIHNINYEEREIPSENLRMLSGSTIVSSLHNYEMYDAMLSKLAIMLDVPKEFFVKINFMYKDNKGMDVLKELYDKVKTEKNLSIDFQKMMVTYDYIYVVDLIMYINSEIRELLLKGEETKENYRIYSNMGATLSLKKQESFIAQFDRAIFLELCNEVGESVVGDYKEFSKYVFLNQNRELINNFIETIGEKSNSKK